MMGVNAARLWNRLMLVFAAALLLFTGQARAQEGGNLIQFVTPWATSSPCFGDASKPLCAVETLIGCNGSARKGPECDRVDPVGIVGERVEKNRVEYYFTRFKIVDKALSRKLWEEYGDGPGNALSVGAFIAVSRKRFCAADAVSCKDVEWFDSICIVGYSSRLKAWTMASCGLLTEEDFRELELPRD
ncbi:hypothetical protein [Ferrovibrio sp.]|uniref:hypothetical protein n=1 Tax=Ferrovibrio sp. TaxID=1917215 RepID=UPI0035AE0B65